MSSVTWNSASSSQDSFLVLSFCASLASLFLLEARLDPASSSDAPKVRGCGPVSVASRAVPSKDVSGSKWYGRRSQPEPCALQVEPQIYRSNRSHPVQGASSAAPRPWIAWRVSSMMKKPTVRRSLRMNCLKPKVKPGLVVNAPFGQLPAWGPEVFGSPRKPGNLSFGTLESRVWGLWEELGVGSSGHLTEQELALVCQTIGLQGLAKETSNYMDGSA
ncbi:ninein-like protein isoform X9 [Cervus elaphus]|uniref:ninein-like protein isoform X9 n=1 Tax=Cervus elaphus TaxID=9860 RepID=UPI001CC29413|nr:ninein-like protein isoform X9 [Cervus elaphus]